MLVTGAALSIAGFAAGTALFVTAQKRDDQAAEQGESLQGLGLADPCGSHPAACAELQERQDSRDAHTIGAAVAYGVGAAALAATVIYGVLASSSSEPSEASSARATTPVELTIFPTVGAARHGHSAAAVLRGRW